MGYLGANQPSSQLVVHYFVANMPKTVKGPQFYINHLIEFSGYGDCYVCYMLCFHRRIEYACMYLCVCVCVCVCIHTCACEYVCVRCMLFTSITMTRLAEQGYKVVGVELSEVAVKRFFTEHQLEHKVVTASSGATVYEVTICMRVKKFIRLRITHRDGSRPSSEASKRRLKLKHSVRTVK